MENHVDAAEGQELAAYDEVFAKNYPYLAELLTVQFYKGKKRQTWTLRIYAEGGHFKAALTDRQNERSCHLTIDSPERVLDDLEAALEAQKLEFRSWSKQVPRSKVG
jgi:hypothetical protein